VKAFADRLAREIERTGKAPSFFLRDDDATRPGPRLDRLLAMAEAHGLPLALAVIPDRAETALADRLAAAPRVAVWQHGFAHRDRARPGEKKSEFPDALAAAAAASDLRRGSARLSILFGPRFKAAFVPPWNRFGAAHLPTLRTLGFDLISDFGALERPAEGVGMATLPARLDPIAWRGDRSAVDEAALVAQLDAGLAAGGPIGLLTHHAVHDAAIWARVEAVVEIFARFGADWYQPAVKAMPFPAFSDAVKGEEPPRGE